MSLTEVKFLRSRPYFSEFGITDKWIASNILPRIGFSTEAIDSSSTSGNGN